MVGFYGIASGDQLHNIGIIYTYAGCGDMLERNMIQLIVFAVILVIIIVLVILCCRGRGKKGI